METWTGQNKLRLGIYFTENFEISCGWRFISLIVKNKVWDQRFIDNNAIVT